jgi:TPP-dependent 2-oxoacid decarboxylase
VHLNNKEYFYNIEIKMSEKVYNQDINQWRYRKKLENFALKFQKISQIKDIEENNGLTIKSFQVYKERTKKQ